MEGKRMGHDAVFRPRIKNAAVAIFLAVWAGHADRAWSETRLRAWRYCPEVISGDFCGFVVTLFLEPKLVQSWLPEGLVLAPETPFDRHPVIVLSGRQQNLARTKRATRYLCGMQDYLETFIAIPYVKMNARPQGPPLFHFVRVYLNNWPATIRGIRRFGWPKICTDMSWTNESYRIGGTGSPIFFARTVDTEHPLINESTGSLQSLQQMLSQPLVLKHEGRFQVYDFNLQFQQALVEPVAVELAIHAGFMPDLPPRRMLVRGIAETPYGAFSIVTHFTKTRIAYGERTLPAMGAGLPVAGIELQQRPTRSDLKPRRYLQEPEDSER